MPNETTQSWENAYTRSEAANPEKTVFNEVVPVEQSTGYSCGSAVFTSIHNTVNKTPIEEPNVIEDFRKVLLKVNLDIENTGVPPRFIIERLQIENIKFSIKESDNTYTDEQVISEALSKLEEELKRGRVCLTPIQYTPSRWMIHSDTHEIINEDDLDPDTDNLADYKVVRTSPQWDGVSVPEPYEGPDAVLATTKNDVDYNGHYVLVVGMVNHMGREFFITMDPSYLWMQSEAMKKKPEALRTINPEYYGYRFIEKPLFGQKWHDVSGEGEPFNQYYISIETK